MGTTQRSTGQTPFRLLPFCIISERNVRLHYNTLWYATVRSRSKTEHAKVKHIYILNVSCMYNDNMGSTLVVGLPYDTLRITAPLLDVSEGM